MANGKLTKYFPGGNTSRGFYSFYDHIIGSEANRIFILKGGPGVGKSTFMRHIGETMLAQGYDVEFHCCSSDNNSLDAICVPAVRVAVIDGTAPHVVDPQNPGVVDEIINLGDFWHADKILPVKQEVLQSNIRVGRLFKIAYHQLAEAKLIKDELDSYLEEAANLAGVHETAWKIIANILDNAPVQFERVSKPRRHFATAFTPGGLCHHLDSILQDVEQLHLVTGEATSLTSYVVGAAAKAAFENGLDISLFHCPLAPDNVDMVLIPQQKCAVMKDIPGISYKPQTVSSVTEVKLYNLDQYMDAKTLAVYDTEIISAQKRLAAALNRAINYLSKAKAEHDFMEHYYIPAMNFEAINARRDAILARILGYAASPGS